MIKTLKEKVLARGDVSKEEALYIAGVKASELFSSANEIRAAFRGDTVDLCSITNAKSGACPENCSYCAQSSKSKADIKTYPLLSKDAVLDRAKEAMDSGAKRFCIVISGKRASPAELKDIAIMIEGIRGLGLLPCATLGLINEDELKALKSSGLERYHHNLETSERFFPEICQTHTYKDKLKTIRAVKSAGLSLCSGGIFGIGEDWQDRIDMAFSLKGLGADSVPINFFIPIKGTHLEDTELLSPLEALKVISLYRFLLPDKEIRAAGGRAQTLGEFNSMVFMAGADGLLIGGYLTTAGRMPEHDLRLIKQWGLKAG